MKTVDSLESQEEFFQEVFFLFCHLQDVQIVLLRIKLLCGFEKLKKIIEMNNRNTDRYDKDENSGKSIKNCKLCFIKSC